jgi:hypothetical protein
MLFLDENRNIICRMNSKILFRKSLFVLFSLALSSALKAAYVPITISSGFNMDVVANGTGPGTGSTSLGATLDAGGYVFAAQDYRRLATCALPAAPTFLPNGGLITNLLTTGPTNYQLESYSANNCLHLSPSTASGTLAFTTPVSADEIYILANSGQGVSTVDYVVTFTDATTQTFTGVTIDDWYGGANVVIKASRVLASQSACGVEVGTAPSGPNLYQYKLTLNAANYLKQVASVTVTRLASSAGFPNVMAIVVNTPCNGKPTVGTTTPAGPVTACLSGNTVLTNTGHSAGNTVFYQWQQSINGGATWTYIANATNSTYTASPTASTMYRFTDSCGITNDTSIGKAITINVTLPVYAPIPFIEDFEVWSNYCATADVPSTNWVNRPSTTDSSWRRNTQGATAAWTNATTGAYTPTAKSGAASARFHSAAANAVGRGNLDLYLNFGPPSPAGDKQLYFYHMNKPVAATVSPQIHDTLEVFLSVNGGGNFTSIGVYDTAVNFARHSLPINTNSPQVVLRFQGRNLSNIAGNNSDIAIDSVYIAGPCTGTPAAGIATASNTAPCAGLSVAVTTLGTTMAGGLTYQWMQSFDNVGWIPAMGGSGANTLFYTSPPLYDTIYYRLDVTCGAGAPVSSASVRVDVNGPGYAVIPYFQNFETWVTKCAAVALPDTNWVNAPPTGNTSWRRNTQGANGGWTTTTGAYTPTSISGTGSARFHSTNVDSTASGNLELAVNCGAQFASKQVEFHYFNATGNDSLRIEYSTDAGFTFNRLAGYTNAAVWQEERIPLPSNSANTIVRFRVFGDKKAANLDDFGLDSVRIVEPCVSVNAGTIVNIPLTCFNAPTVLYLVGSTQQAGLTYDWQSSPDGITWTSTGNTLHTYTSLITTPTYYRVIVTCNNGPAPISDTTPVQFIGIKPFYDCYCTSTATVTTGADIGNVKLESLPGNMLKFSNGGPYAQLNNIPLVANKIYTNFMNTLPPIQIHYDSTYRLSVTQINSAAFNAANASAYIDWDRNGTFDPSEQILLASTSSTSTPPQIVTSQFTVPNTTDTGITGMRVVMTQGASANVCGVYNIGETEDYFVRIMYPPCGGPANPGIAYISDTSACIGHEVMLFDTAYQKGVSGIITTWQTSPDSFSWANIPNSLYEDTILHTVTAKAYFRMQFVCATPVSLDTTWSNVVSVSINPPVSCYCISRADGGLAKDSSDIGGFLFETFTNNVGGPHLKNPLAYRSRTDYTRMAYPNLWVDSTYDFTLFHIMKSQTHADGKVTIFIDYNSNLQYDYLTELAYTGYTTAGNFTITGSVTIPHNALPDLPTGMRVIINNDTGPNVPSDQACGIYTSGETEDYVVVVRSPLTSKIDALGNITHLNLYPNPTTGRFKVRFDSPKALDKVKVSVVSVMGSKIQEQSYSMNGAREFSNDLDISDVAKGIYFVEIEADGQKLIRKLILQ